MVSSGKPPQGLREGCPVGQPAVQGERREEGRAAEHGAAGGTAPGGREKRAF